MKPKILLFIFVASFSAFGKEPPDVIKLVIRFKPGDLSQNSPPAKPKTLYLAGPRYARIEQETDSAFGAPDLIIVNEPDIWTINRAAKVGNHSINPGPDFSVHNPVLGPDCPDNLFDFEFGREVDFMERVKAQSLESKEIGSRKCKTMQFEIKPYRILLFLDATSNSPVQLQVFEDDRIKFTVDYLSYEKNVPFDPALFQPAKDVTLTEAHN